MSSYQNCWTPKSTSDWRAHFFTCLKAQEHEENWEDMEVDCDECDPDLFDVEED